MAAAYEIRADYDQQTIVVYQAYAPAIAEPALAQQRFVPPFSFRRMTWIKPSFLWLMHRSNWGQKSGQQRILAVRLLRAGWDRALSLGVLTHPEPAVSAEPAAWQENFRQAQVHIQWDPERSLRGAGLNHYSIQVGISRHLIREFVDEWIVELRDLTSEVAKMRRLLASGNAKAAQRLLPREKVYPVEPAAGKHLLLG